MTGFKDDPFLKGMQADLEGEGRDILNDWVPGFKKDKDGKGGVDGVLLVCGTEQEVKDKRSELAQKYLGSKQGISHIMTLDGRERPGALHKHEQ